MKKRLGVGYIELMVSGTVVAFLSLSLIGSLAKGVEKIEKDFNIYSETMRELGIEMDDVDLDIHNILKDYIDFNNCVEVDNETYCKIEKGE
jgi:hypothetical protein